MSSYWAAYYGDALVLTGDEFENFVDKYAEVNGIPRNTIFDDETIEEYAFCKSEDLNKTFHIAPVLKDNCDGMHLIPFKYNGEDNVYVLDENGKIKQFIHSKILRDKDCYAIFSERNRYGIKAFSEPPYHSYEELKHEFQNILQDYLPNNFDWDDHIGNFSYAAYA